MRILPHSLVLTMGLAGCSLPGVAQSAARACPVTLGHVELSYKHQGGESKPQLRLAFSNRVRKTISTATFALLILDTSGTPHPYPDELVFRDGLETKKSTLFTTELNADAVDIHRAGETVILQSVEFADATRWKDDGSESCSITVDYHAR